MLINEKMKMADVIIHDPTLVPIINRFGIYLGFGDATIEEICHKKNLNVQFFITIINAFHDSQYFPARQLQNFSVELIIDYLQKAHRYFLEEKLPEISELIEETIEDTTDKRSPFMVILKFLTRYKEELTRHIGREEEIVYPYVLKLNAALFSGEVTDALKKQVQQMPIEKYEAEHENVEAKIFDLKNIIIRHLPVPNNQRLWYKILREIFTLEKELNEHARIEDLILVPKVEIMEQKILKGKK